MYELTRLSEKEYRLISELVYKQFGIKLGENKKSLIVGRLQKILKQNNFKSFQDYYDYVTNDTSGQALITLVDRISTNHTFFYREYDHFDFFYRRNLPYLESILNGSKDRALRIWCAGCSSGEEPYMLAILMLEYFKENIMSWNVGVLATDISISSLETAVAGIYSSENINHLPGKLKSKYFIKIENDQWKVIDRVKRLVTFKRLNLMRETYPFKNRFHAIFCRNVMIYFDQPTRDALIRRYHRYMMPNGHLFIGHSESLRRDNGLFKYIQPSVYSVVS